VAPDGTGGPNGDGVVDGECEHATSDATSSAVTAKRGIVWRVMA